jgi:hypothetical protein
MKKIWNFIKGKPQYYVPVLSLVLWFLIWAACNWFGLYSPPVGYWVGIFYGITGAAIILWAAYIMFAAWNPHLKNDIDTDPTSFIKLSPWQRALLAFLFVALFVWSATELAKGL